MARPAHKTPSVATVQRRNNRAKWRETRRFTGFAFDAAMYDRAKATWEQQRATFSGDEPAGRATFTDWVAASINAFEHRAADEQAAFLNDYMQRAAVPAAPVTVPVVGATSDAAPDEPAPFDFNSLAELSNDEAMA